MQCQNTSTCSETIQVPIPLLQWVPHTVSLQPLASRGTFSVNWSPPTDLCGLTNPQYIIQYGTTTSSYTNHTRTPTSSPLSITGLAVGQEYFVSVAIRTQSGSSDFSSWQSVTTYEGVHENNITVLLKMHACTTSSAEVCIQYMCKCWIGLCRL